MRKRKIAGKVLYFAVILILVLVMMFSGLQILESTVLYRGQEEVYESRTIERDGVKYFPRKDITTVLVMGIDQIGPVQDSGSYTNRGTADMVMLVILDEKNEAYSVLALNRDTMLEMPVLGIGGKRAGTEYGQLALSHSFGSGLEDSCENTVNTVSDFLYGVDIDYYVSLNMDAIAILNDAVGGVTVNNQEDFSEVDSTIIVGDVTLRGEQALHYLRSRKDVGNQLNLSRMERHRNYMQSFSRAFREKIQESDSFVLKTYEKVTPYVVTNCSSTVLTSMMERYGTYSLQEIVSPAGENVRGEEYMEFYVDEAKLDELILRLLYAPK